MVALEVLGYTGGALGCTGGTGGALEGHWRYWCILEGALGYTGGTGGGRRRDVRWVRASGDTVRGTKGDRR